MASITISVPDVLSDWIDQQVRAGGYASAGDYLADLVRQEREDREGRADLVAELERGEASGVSPRRVLDILSDLRREAAGRAK